MAKNNEQESNARNHIALGTAIVGNIDTNGDIRIDGELKGTIKSTGKVVIGESGKIEGEINCQNANISGKVKGKIMVKEMLSMLATAVVSGDIITGKLAIEPGATFTGNCSMGAVIKEISRDSDKTAQNPREKHA